MIGARLALSPGQMMLISAPQTPSWPPQTNTLLYKAHKPRKAQAVCLPQMLIIIDLTYTCSTVPTLYYLGVTGR